MKYEVDEKRRLELEKKIEKCVGVVIFSILLFMVIYSIDFHTSLSQNGKTTKGVVIRVGTGYKAAFHYEYTVNNKKYVDHTKLGCMPYKIELGDTIDIRYDSN